MIAMTDAQGTGTAQGPRLGLSVATTAVMTSVTVVFCLFVRIPTGRGYLNLCDVAIYFCAFVFNPMVAMVSGALGTAVADILSGYPQWALISLVVHGAEGFCVAWVLHGKNSLWREFASAFTGVLVVAGGYFALGGLLLTGFGAALVEVPGNILQASVGAVLGFSVSRSVVRAYPPVSDLGIRTPVR